jgi:hypothetical protein
MRNGRGRRLILIALRALSVALTGPVGRSAQAETRPGSGNHCC